MFDSEIIGSAMISELLGGQDVSSDCLLGDGWATGKEEMLVDEVCVADSVSRG